MSFRLKLLLACLPLALAPLAFFGVRARQGVTDRLARQYAERVTALAGVIGDDLEHTSADVAARLDGLAEAMAADNRFRLSVIGQRGGGRGEVTDRTRPADRAYLLDYASRVMPLAGLDLLRIQDEQGRVLSSGHFRNEYDAIDPALPAALARAGARAVLVATPTAAGSMLALARARSLRLGSRTLTLVGGTAVDDRFLDRLARGTGLEVELQAPTRGKAVPSEEPGSAILDEARPGAAEVLPEPNGTGPLPQPEDASRSMRMSPAAERDRAIQPRSRTEGTEQRGRRAVPSRDRITAGPPRFTREVIVPFAGLADDTTARFVVRASTEPLDALRRNMDRWLLAMLAAAAVLALLLTLVVSAGLGRPLAELARKAGRLDLDRLDAGFATTRGDEIGTLSRVLDGMTRRLRASAGRLREAERRATIGDVARQVNHDVRNGLIPIRNVVGHFTQLAREQPDELATVVLERQRTLESSIGYLHSLAANYARLSPKLDPRPCDVNAVVRDVVDDVRCASVAAPAYSQSPDTHGDRGRVADSDRRRRPAARARRQVPSGDQPIEDATAGAPQPMGRFARGGGADSTVRIVTDLAPNLPPVRADPIALRRILENLVANALESFEGDSAAGRAGRIPYGDPGRVLVSTRLDDAQHARRILLTVRDTGPGMTVEQRARIFDDFYTTKQRGTGLGLSIVRRLVSDLDGRISIESEPGEGTRFTVELPPVSGDEYQPKRLT